MGFKEWLKEVLVKRWPKKLLIPAMQCPKVEEKFFILRMKELWY